MNDNSRQIPLAPETLVVVLYALIDWALRRWGFLAGSWDELLLILIAGIYIIRVGVYHLRPGGSSLLIPIAVYMAVMVFLVLVNSPNRGIAIAGVRVMIEYILWFFVGYNLILSRLQARVIVDAFLLVCLLIGLYGIYQYVVGVEIPATWIDSKIETSLKTRVFSILGSPNVLGSLMMMAIPISLACMLGTKNWLKKAVYAGVGGIMTLTLLFTYSRGAWLAVALAIVLLGLWLDRRIIYALIIAAILTPVALPTVYDRLAYMTTPEYQASSERGGRIGRWDKALAYWQNRPALGLGLGQFGGAVAAQNFPDDSFYVDNWYLKVGTETGWVGLGSTLLLFVCCLNAGRRATQRTKGRFSFYMATGVLAGLTGVLAHNAVENIFEVPMMAVYFWFFLGMLLALPGLSPPEEEQETV